MRGNTHVRFGGAGRGNRTSVTTSLRPGPIPTNRADLNTIQADQFHREHATVELVIRDLKEGAGLEHLPSGNHHANAAWLACAVLAHNIGTWTTTIAELASVKHRTRRTKIISLPAVIVNHAGTMLLRFPARWPWATEFDTMLDHIRALPAPSG